MTLVNRIKKVEEVLRPSPLRKRYIFSIEEIVQNRKAFGNFINAERDGFKKHSYSKIREIIIPTFTKILQKDEVMVGEGLDNFIFHTLNNEERIDFFFEYLFTDWLPDNYEFKFFSSKDMSWLNRIIIV